MTVRKAKGLGKRNTQDRDLEDENVLFPLQESLSESDALQIMYQHALISLDEPEKCLPLFRAIVHECDRVGRLKDILEASDGVLEDVDEEEIEHLKARSLDAKFYFVFGDSLFRLALLEEKDNDSAIHKEYLEASIERLENGLDSYPEDITLKQGLCKARTLQVALNGASEWKAHIQVFLECFEDDVERYLQFVELLELLCSIIEMKDLEELCEEHLDHIKNLLKSQDVTIEQRCSLSKLPFVLLEYHFDEDKYEKCQGLVDFVEKLLFVDDDNNISDDLYKALSVGKAQLAIWKGCLAEAHEEDPDRFYQEAIDLHTRLNDKFGVPIPDEILELNC